MQAIIIRPSEALALDDALSRAAALARKEARHVLRDPYTNKPFVHFYTTKRVGGGVQDFDAIKLLKCAT
jgi:HK97 family phage major capsid protein